MPSLTDRAWSPYVAGVLIGLLQIPALLFLDTALGTSSSYVTLGATLVTNTVDPGIAAIRYAASHLSGPKNWWQVAMVVGIAAGAYLSARLSGTRRSGVSPVWQRAMGNVSTVQRFAMAFGAGFVMLLGARIADGCTSGHGVSGIAQLGLGSFTAVTAMFAGGIAMAVMLRRI